MPNHRTVGTGYRLLIFGVMTVSEEFADEVGRGNFCSADVIRPRDIGANEGEEPAQDRAAKLHGLRRPLDCLHLALSKRCRSVLDEKMPG
jgi:hypothetical protein